MKKGTKIIVWILGIVILLIILVVGLFYYFVSSKMDKLQYDVIDLSEIEVPETVQSSEIISQYRNIAILGIDTREDTYEGSRSDCIIIASINNATKEVNLVSVYRDCYLDIPGKGLDKVTHAHAYGGPALTMSTLNRNLDLNITEEVTVNFNATKEIVDAVGGIDLTIDEDEVKHITGIEKAGNYHLNGEQALQYARIRKEAGGDYKRTERMRTVLMAVFQKAKTLSVSELNTLADQILPIVSTNIEKSEIISMIPQFASYSIKENIGWPYEVKGITLDRWYGVPVSLEENVTRLHQEIFEQENYEVSETIKNISKQIEAKTGVK